MSNYIVLAIVMVSLRGVLGASKPDSLGCYKDVPGAQVYRIETKKNPADCVTACTDLFYRYAFHRSGEDCYCGNYLGDKYSELYCHVSCKKCPLQFLIADAYQCVLVPGPPKNFKIENITDTQAHMSWEIPSSYVGVDHFMIKGVALMTYAVYKVNTIMLNYSNNTSTVELISLHPGTKYNISVQAMFGVGPGVLVYKVINTEIGVPDHIPSPPTIIESDDMTITINVHPVINNNGPVSMYLVAVVNVDTIQTLQIDNLKNYRDAVNEGLTYYIAAEIHPLDINKPFVVGDGAMYGIYYNAKLTPGINYNILVGIKSQAKGITKLLFSNYSRESNDVLVLQLPIQEESSSIIIVFYVAIGVLTFLLILVVIAFFLLRHKISTRNRQRLNDNQELTMQGPMIDMENNGYIPEEEMDTTNPVESLRSKVWNIPPDSLKVDPNFLLGVGKYGHVANGIVQRENRAEPVAVYVVNDNKLNRNDKRDMLKDLDVLIRIGKHHNVIELVGICEVAEVVNIILVPTLVNLKELLLKGRVRTSVKTSTILESQAMDIAIQICRGMAHLGANNIVHRQLCARNIGIVNGIPKITGCGMAQYNNTNVSANYTRWTAKEIFRGQPHTKKSDVWSYACLLWEISSLGGTPYGNTKNNEIPDKVLRGMRLQQLPAVSDNLYQIMLNCWQLDLDERPSFLELKESLLSIMESMTTPCLNFLLTPNFQYEPFNLELELIPNNI